MPWRSTARIMVLTLLPALTHAQDTLRLGDVLVRAEGRGALVAQARVGLDRAESERTQGWRALLPQVSGESGLAWREGRPQIFNGVTFGAPSSTLGSSAGVQATLSIGVARIAQVRASNKLQSAAELDVAAARSDTRLLAAASFFEAGLAQSQAALQDSLVSLSRLQLAEAAERMRLGLIAPYDVDRLRGSLNAQEALALRAHAAWESAVVALGVVLGRRLDPDRTHVLLPDMPPVASGGGSVTRDIRDTPGVRSRASRLDALRASARVERLAQWPVLQAFISTSGFTNSFTDRQYVVAQTIASVQAPCYEVARIRSAVGQVGDASACAAVQPTAQELAGALAGNRTFPWRLSRNPIVAGFTISLPLLDVTSLRRREEARLAAEQAAADLGRVQDEVAVRVGSASATLDGARRALAVLDSAVVQSRRAAIAVQERNREGLAPLSEVLLARAEYERIARDRLAAVSEALRARFVLDELSTPATASPR